MTFASHLNSRARSALLFALAAALCAGCQTIETYMPVVQQLGVYKIDINQGNYLSQDMVDRLQVGMSRQQVRGTLGTPLLTSAFRDSRWDYVYEFTRQGRVREHRQFTVYFADEKLARWEGDEMPQSVVELNRAAGEKALKKQPDADDQGFFGKILDWFKKN
ncbi:MAG: outer membrane protein assembly factor BamE [Casimicrobiaceae bacterium]